MQIMIDTDADTTSTLRRLSLLLADVADERSESAASILKDADVPAGTPAAPRDDAPAVDTAAIFGGKAADAPAAPVAPAAPAAPVAPPAPIAPAAPVAPIASAGAELDSSGLPWDGRIHQESRKQNKDKTWQNRRGLDKTLLSAVEAELRFNLKQLGGATPAAPVAPLPPTAPVAPPAPTSAPGPSGNLAVPPATPGGVTGFRELMQKITSNTNAGKLTNEQVDAALHSVGIPPRQLIALVSAPQHIPSVTAYIDACLAAG